MPSSNDMEEIPSQDDASTSHVNLIISPFGWPVCNPDYVVTVMKELTKADHGLKVEFFKSYPKWSSMAKLQQNKTLAFFNDLTPANREYVCMGGKACH